MDSINNACKFGSDAWLELQEFKNRQLNRREKLNRHRDLINGIALSQNKTTPLLISTQRASTASTQASSSSQMTHYSSASTSNNHAQTQASHHHPQTSTSGRKSRINNPECNSEIAYLRVPSGSEQFSSSNCRPSSLESEQDLLHQKSLSSCNHRQCNNSSSPSSRANCQLQHHQDEAAGQKLTLSLEIAECLLLLKLCDVALKLPIDSRALLRSITKVRGLESLSKSQLENLLQKLSHQELITIEEPTGTLLRNLNKKNQVNIDDDDGSCIYVTSADHTKLVEFDKSFGSLDTVKALLLESRSEELASPGMILDEILLANHATVGKSQISLISGTHGHSFRQKLSSSKNVNRETKSTKLFNPKLSHTPEAIKSFSGSPTKLANFNSEKKALGEDLESLLSLTSTRERESKKLGEELLELLSKPTVKERNLMERFRSADGYQVQEFCPKGTKGECNRNNNGAGPCDKLHFKKILAKHTEETLGDCSFLNTCFHMDSCKYVHYEVDYGKKPQQLSRKLRKSSDSTLNTQLSLTNSSQVVKNSCQANCPSIQDKNNNSRISCNDHDNMIKSTCSNTKTPNIAQMSTFELREILPSASISIDGKTRKRYKTILHPPQWIQCDLRFFDMSLLGKFSVVMADPPWDIHMELPYGTMSDEEMRKLNIPALQDKGVIFLWVTGRAMELGRECLALWGYERCDEIIWVKTNQLQRIIRTGRTGHWLNHGKEHCLVGVKGNPTDINRGLDCDVIVAEVRATSHKPDEIYGIIERLSPGTRKIELFGRAHNVQPNWITLGNQLNGVKLVEPDLVDAFKKSDIPFETDAT